MKLAEALAMRSDMQKRLAQIRERLLRNATVQDGEQPAEDPAALLAQFDEVADALARSIGAINLTNATARVEAMSMTEALARREVLKLQQATYRDLAEAGTLSQRVLTRSEVRFRSTVSVAGVQRQADELAKALRELDHRIQEANWKTELQQ